MDPDENLRSQLVLVKRIKEDPSDLNNAMRLAELVEALDEWIRNGGMLPVRWIATKI